MRETVESEDLFRAFVTATSDVVYRMSADWTEMRQLEGRDFIADTIDPNRSWLDKYIHPDDQAAVMAAIRRAIDAKIVFELEHRVISVDGSLGWTHSRAVPMLDADGHIVEWIGTARNISTRHTVDEEVTRLRASSEQQRRLYEAILSTTPDLVYVFGLDHRFIYANHALLTMWGRTWDDAIGHNCLELGYEPWHAEMHDREIEQVMATKQPIRGEVPFTGTHGRRIYDYIFVPVFGATGDVVAVAGTTRDITEIKQSENALRESEHQLAAANRLKDEFLATLSHELRTPLNAILGWAHMLQSLSLQPGVLERAVQSIDRNARAQAQLVDDLLDVSRVISGKLAIKHEPVNVRAVIGEATDAIRPAVAAKALRLRMEIAPDADIVLVGDADRLRQVIWNLLSNAVKFTPPAGEIDITVRRAASALEISVRDTGVGIEASFLPHVFERFRQADSTPARKHGGLGLGLAIARHLVEAHGGTVSALSDGPGAGAEFVIRLPLDGARPRPLPAVAPQRGAVQPLIAGLRVLVTDDDADARDVVRTLLESHGAAVTTVPGGPATLSALAASRFDVLVADIGMPDQDGYSLIRSIRRLPGDAGGAIPAIAVTAYATLRDRDDAINAGFSAHMGKPFDPSRLIETIASLAAAESPQGSC